MNKKILLFVIMLVVCSYSVVAWDPNPVYDPFEILWNAIDVLDNRTNETYMQRRINDICPAGSSIRAVNGDGTVVCEADDSGLATCSDCDGSFVNEGQVNSITSDMIADGSVTSAKIIDGGIVAADVDSTEIQRRVSGSCPAGQSIRSVNQDGTVVCEMDDDSQLSEAEVDAMVADNGYLLDSGDTATGNYDFDSGTLVIDSVNNRVGIGTTSPSHALEVEASSSVGGIMIDNVRVAGGDPVLFLALNGLTKFSLGVDDDDNDKFKIGASYPNSNTKLTIDSSGNVGIGTTSPTNKLDINTDSHISGISFDGKRTLGGYDTNTYLWLNPNNDFTSGVYVPFNFRVDGNTYLGNSIADNIYPRGYFEAYPLHVGNSGTENYVDGDGDLYVEDELEVDGNLIVDGTTLFVSASGNKVGIGTTNPNSKLSVGGDGVGAAAIYSTGSGYGIYAVGLNYGGYFANPDTGIADNFGVRGAAYGSGGSGRHYAGYFTASGGSQNTGVLGQASGSGTNNYGGYFTASGATNNYAVYSDGDLFVDGAYKGDIGPNNGAPFPRPAYDSGWQSTTAGTTLTLTHDVGGNADNYVVDLQFKHPGTYGVNNMHYGGYYWIDNHRGAYWYALTNSNIKVFRKSDDYSADKIRVRIWVYN